MWLVATAAAADPAPPTWGTGAGVGPWAVIRTPNRDVVTDFDVAAQLHAGFAVRPPLWLEAEWATGIADGGLRWAPRAQVALLNPGAVVRPGITAGVSWQGASSTDPTVTTRSHLVPHWGPTLSVHAKGPWVRVDLRHSIETTDPRNPTHHLLAVVGLEWLSAPRPEPVGVAPPPPAPPPPAPATADFTVSPANEVWISHPLCAWVPAAEAPAWIATAPGPVTVVADGYLPVVVDPHQPHDLVLQPVAHGGAVIVAAAPGDHVFVDDVPTPVSRDGVAVVNTSKDLVSVRVEGGGRTLSSELAPADGWAVWFRATALPLLEIRFDQGSAAPGPDTAVIVGELVRTAGDRVYRLQGSWSPEGRDAVNRRLATQRAEAVRKLFLDAGFDPRRIEILPPSQLDSPDPAAARVVLISSAAPETP